MTRPAPADVTRAWYEANARRYDRLHPGVAGDIAYYAALARGRRVVEIGAGTGRMSAALAGEAAQLIALDHSPAMLGRAVARLRGIERAHVLCADARALPLRGRFELAVLAYRTVQHLADAGCRLQLFCELRTLLAPAGVLAFDTWHGPASHGRSGSEPMLVPVTEREIAGELAAAGLALLRVDGGFQGEPAGPATFVRVWQVTVAPATGR